MCQILNISKYPRITILRKLVTKDKIIKGQHTNLRECRKNSGNWKKLKININTLSLVSSDDQKDVEQWKNKEELMEIKT